jgi:FkbM family methyltransferase
MQPSGVENEMLQNHGRLSLRGDRLRLARVLNYGKRAATRVVSMPVCLLPEGRAKQRVRLALLKVQNSLPTELAVNAGDVVVQVGTPWPATMRRFRRAVGKSGRIVIFEAFPANAERLRNAVRDSGYDNVTVFEGAAFSARQSGTLRTSPHRGDNKIAVDGVRMDNDLRAINADMGEIAVEFYRIDDVLAQLGIKQVDYLSVTVNGAELEVLKGAEATLRNSSGIRVYSKGHARLENGQPINTLIKPYLESLGFQAVISKGEPSSALDEGWLQRDGDVYAWRQP